MLSLLHSLNPEQKKAVLTTEGRVLVLAGAGSGKTKVLTLRMAYLIDQCNVHPNSILGLTFTNKAALEMQSRIGKIVEDRKAKQIMLCTFHSFCMYILRKEIAHLGYTKSFSLYDEYDVQRLITQIARDLLKHESHLPSLAPSIQAINQARNQNLKPEDLASTGNEWHDTFVKELYRRFIDSMRAYNAVDFDNLLCLTVRLFKEHPSILERYQERFRYIMIDEYQDTNQVQYMLASLLSAKYNNLCVVGDDDQSIYGWRGAEVKHILGFENATTIKLEQNYRSTNVILKAANSIISNNQERHNKALWSQKDSSTLIEIFHAPNEVHEAEAVIHRLAKLKEEKNLKWKDFAILYRSNALSRNFEQSLLKYTWKNKEQWVRGIPYRIFGGEEYYERREVKDLIAYLRVILNPQDQEALLRIINLPRRGIGDESLDKITSYNRAHNLSLWNVLSNISDHPELSIIQEKTKSSITQFIQIIEESKEIFKKQNLPEGMQWLIDKTSFKRSIDEEVKSDKMRAFKWENVQEFINALAQYEEGMKSSGRGDEISLHDFVTSTPLGQDKAFNKKKDLSEDRVTLMTFHSAKGLEFTACYLVGMEDNIIPHEKSMRETGIEEERRLMYVAVTRAKENLTCSMARERKRMGREAVSTPSRFLLEIPKDLIKITKWDS